MEVWFIHVNKNRWGQIFPSVNCRSSSNLCFGEKTREVARRILSSCVTHTWQSYRKTQGFRAEPQAFTLVPICIFSPVWRQLTKEENMEKLSQRKRKLIPPAEKTRWGGLLKKPAPPFSSSHTSPKNSPCSHVVSKELSVRAISTLIT